MWKTQPWYPLLLAMLVDQPRLLPIQQTSHTESDPLTTQLAVWSVSGSHSVVKAFQAKLQSSSLGHGEIRQTSVTAYSLGDRFTGVVNEVQIHFLGPVSDVANSLASLHQEGYQYNSLNAYRSAISSVHERVDGVPIGQHSTIVRLLKEAYNARPPTPSYSGTWDEQRVLNYIESMGRSKNLELKHLNLKTVFLLATTRPSRSADLANLEVKRMKANNQKSHSPLRLLPSNHIKGNQLQNSFSHPFRIILVSVQWTH